MTALVSPEHVDVLVIGAGLSGDEGYPPEFKGSERFAGQIVHPQNWADDIDYAGKRGDRRRARIGGHRSDQDVHRDRARALLRSPMYVSSRHT